MLTYERIYNGSTKGQSLGVAAVCVVRVGGAYLELKLVIASQLESCAMLCGHMEGSLPLTVTRRFAFPTALRSRGLSARKLIP